MKRGLEEEAWLVVGRGREEEQSMGGEPFCGIVGVGREWLVVVVCKEFWGDSGVVVDSCVFGCSEESV